jgi:hypothetical protein
VSEVKKLIDEYPGTILISLLMTIFLVWVFVTYPITSSANGDTSTPETQAISREAEAHREHVKKACANLDNLTRDTGVRYAADVDTDECVIMAQVNLKTDTGEVPLIGEYSIHYKSIETKRDFQVSPALQDAKEKNQNLCYNGKQVHIEDGYAEGVYQKFLQDKPDDQYQDTQKRIRNARLLDSSCDPNSIQMMVWNGQDTDAEPHPIRIVPAYGKEQYQG